MSTITIIFLIIILFSLAYLIVYEFIIKRTIILPKIAKKHVILTLKVLLFIAIFSPFMVLFYFMAEYPLLALIALPFILFIPITKN